MSYALLAHVLQIYIGIRTYGHNARTYGYSMHVLMHIVPVRTDTVPVRTDRVPVYTDIVPVRTDIVPVRTGTMSVHQNFISVRTGTSGTGTSTNMTHLWRTITQDSANISKFRLRVSVEDGSVVLVAKCQQLLSGVRTLVHTQNLYQSPYRAPHGGAGQDFWKKSTRIIKYNS